MHLHEYAAYFDEKFHTYLDQQIARTQPILKERNFYIAYIKEISQKGKRVRPYNVALTFWWYGSWITSDISAFLIAFELFHTFALIHDDWIDHADMRRSVPTCHKHYEQKIGNSHIAASQAILVGDICFSRAYEQMEIQPQWIKSERLSAARGHFHKMVQEVVWGQMLDVDFMLWNPVSIDAVTTKSYYKTASYTFVRPFLAGAALAWLTDPQELEKIKKLGKEIGIGYQMRDDLLDMYKPHQDKSVFNDLQEGQQTVLTQYVFDNGTKEQKKFLREKMGTLLSDQDKQDLTHLFTVLWAFDYGIQTTNGYLDQASQTLQTMNITYEARIKCENLIQLLRVN